jgi:hypothetical protein
VPGALTPEAVHESAKRWRAAAANNPHATFIVMVGGYDDDPRELWDLPEVVRFVRDWAQAAGIHSPNDLPEVDPSTSGFLAACGLFGEAVRRLAVSAHCGKAVLQ